MSNMQSQRERNSSNSVNYHDSERAEQKLQLAIACHREGRIKEASSLYEEVLAAVHDNPCANFNLATIYHDSGELRKAIACYKKVLANDADNFQVLYNLASAYRDNGFLEQSAITFQRALEVDSQHPDIHYNLGILYHQLNFLEESSLRFKETLKLEPEHFPSLYNLGAICFERKLYDKALEYYNRAHSCDLNDLDCCYNLGLTHFHLGDYEEAASCYEQVLLKTPEDAALYNTLGTVYRHLNDYKKAVKYHQKALDLKPDYGNALTNLAIVFQILGNTRKAITCFERSVELGYDVESAEYMITALTGGSRSSAPRSYVERLFDNYAVDFDKSLVKGLNYDVPAKLYALHESLFHSNTKYRHVIDLGCGTGLAGEQFRDVAVTLTGVDLSSKMIEQSKRKGIYNNLHHDDTVDFLKNSTSSYDLVLAADVIVYIGEIDPLFSAVADKISPNGLFLFSIEENEGEGYRLRQSGRYAYNRKYIKEISVKHGFLVEYAWSTNLRKEKDEWIKGCLFALKKV